MLSQSFYLLPKSFSEILLQAATEIEKLVCSLIRLLKGSECLSGLDRSPLEWDSQSIFFLNNGEKEE
jgi:hypothetical protein